MPPVPTGFYVHALEGTRHSSPTEEHGEKGEASPATYHFFLLHTIVLCHYFIISFNAYSFTERVR